VRDRVAPLNGLDLVSPAALGIITQVSTNLATNNVGICFNERVYAFVPERVTATTPQILVYIRFG
jgi:hypothetical protein